MRGQCEVRCALQRPEVVSMGVIVVSLFPLATCGGWGDGPLERTTQGKSA